MAHRLLIALARMIANTFFRRIDVVGLENVPADGPLIFAGNHPNALMDGFLLNATCGLNYIHRHRFRSQVLIEFGEPIDISDSLVESFQRDEQATV